MQTINGQTGEFEWPAACPDHRLTLIPHILALAER